jgi:hypothetical protein
MEQVQVFLFDNSNLNFRERERTQEKIQADINKWLGLPENKNIEITARLQDMCASVSVNTDNCIKYDKILVTIYYKKP